MSFDHHQEDPSAIRSNLGAIFVSLELSRSTWLMTSLSPGNGEKMSKHSVSARDIAALRGRFSELTKRYSSGRENPSRSSSFRRQGWTAFGFIVSF
jgi:transposase